ncbi:MAG: endolytic transglycosylase MltG, partial [Oscillibacter sp.]|nr:endolytic transglycosylase MltG [Oscillibacter sp.]
LAEWGWMLASDFCAFGQGDRRTASVVVTMDDNVRDVSEKLYDAGLIKYRWFFRLFARFAHAEEKIGAGVYELNTDMDYQALIRGMRNSSGSMTTEQVRITIPEGYNVYDIISLLAKNGVATREELEEAARTAEFKYDFIDNDSEDISRLEGYLVPDTYDFFKPERPVSALNKLLANFERKQDSWEGELAYAQTRGYDLHKIVTIASLIEKETDGSDQARIASVIYNRLDGPGDKAGTYGLLQIDAALLYALPEHTGPITSNDLETNSPYNLYKNPGLPPTAIANPGAKCIEAALTPESTDYYYYALAKDGKHRFFTNYREFSDFLSSGDYIGN